MIVGYLQAKQFKGNMTMKNIIFKTLQVLLILAFVIIGFVFVGAFVEYKTLNGANVYAGLVFATVLCTAISAIGFVVIKETVLN
ncbi:hypothetical protein AB9_158 [Acinetobacter phage vB_AbaM_B9]|nr:hypothetical protein AB9_002 [Acinetobacter phage vB_AbaM_B9]AWD93301.1 hypothetical protein AB9_158 [Acinetobacter phage vB_AbaM_B9]